MEKEAVQAENVSSEVLKVVTPSFAAKGLVLKENIEPAVLYGCLLYTSNNKRIQAKTKWMPPVQYRIASMCSA